MTDLRDELLNDPSAGARRLVSEYGDRLFSLAYGLCANAADAEDLTFRTFEQAIVKIAQFDASHEIFPWLRSILVNFYRMDLRRKGAHALVFTDDLPSVEDASAGPDELCLRRVDARVVEAAVQSLPETHRAVVTLRYEEDLPLDEIARLLSIPCGTVKSRLHQAKRILKEKLAVYFRERGCDHE